MTSLEYCIFRGAHFFVYTPTFFIYKAGVVRVCGYIGHGHALGYTESKGEDGAHRIGDTTTFSEDVRRIE